MSHEPWEAEEVTLEDLFEDGRFADADALLARALDDGVVGPWALSLRAICQAELGRKDAALAMARRAVELDPESALGHWCLGSLLHERNRFAEALEHAERAIELDPGDPRPHGLRARVHAAKEQWSACLASCEAGLALDPSDEVCMALRALALRAKETGADWSAALQELAHQNPASAWARSGLGWNALETGQADEAKVHFEQALALDPTAEWARSGLIEALKARNPLYSAILQLFLWIDRLPPRTRWIYFLGGWFGYRYLRVMADQRPEIAPLLYPLMAIWVLFLVVSWTSGPLSDFVLSRTPAGRRLIRGERLLAARLVTGLLGFAVLAGAGSMIVEVERLTIAALCSAFLVIPVAAVFQCSPGWPRKAMLAYTGVAVAASVAALLAPGEEAPVLALVAVLLSALGSWLAAFLRSRIPVE